MSTNTPATKLVRGTKLPKKNRGWKLTDPKGKTFKAVSIARGKMDGKRVITFWLYPNR